MSIRVYAFTCGWLVVPLALLLEGEKGRLRVPVPSYLIEHPRGRALFDTGLHLETQTRPDEWLGRLARYHTVHYLPGEEIASRLALLSIDPARIDFIINSHLHFDHCGGNVQVPNATLLLQRREWEAAHDADLIERVYYAPHDYDHGHHVKLVEGEYDVFGDGSVTCIPTYGHTPGHQSLRLKLDNGEAVLTGDACYLRRTLVDLHLPTSAFDKEAMRDSIHRLRALDRSGATVIAGHDPDMWKTIPQAPNRLVVNCAAAQS
jgi:N-acyl homoserine lactone hydrolase